MNVVELLAVVRKCFEQQNPKVLIPKKFSKQKMQVLDRARKEADVDTSGASLMNLTKIWVRMLSDKDDKAYEKCMNALKKLDTLPPALMRRLQKKQGEGQLRFTVESPAGPSRLCRVPFYPIRTENAWSSRFIDIDSATPSRQSFGIEELGDDPIINIGPWFGQDGDVAYQNSIKMPTIQLMTQKVEFGAYRLVGMEINAYFGSRYIGAIRDGAAATGSIEIVGTPTAATGSVITSGPVPVAASADVTFDGPTGDPATASIDFSTTTPTASTGQVSSTKNGTLAGVTYSMPNPEVASSGQLVFAYNPPSTTLGSYTTLPATGGLVTIASDGTPGAFQLQFTSAGGGFVDGDSITIPYASLGSTASSRTYTARNAPVSPTTEFQIVPGDIGATATNFVATLAADIAAGLGPYFTSFTLSSNINQATINITANVFSSSTILNGVSATTGAPATILIKGPFASATNAGFDDGEGFILEEPDGTTHTFVFRDTGPLAANEYYTSTSRIIAAGGMAFVINGGPAPFNATQSPLGVINIDQQGTGSSGNTAIVLSPTPNPGVTTTAFSGGTDVIPDGTTIQLIDTLGNVFVLEATLGAPVGSQFQVRSTYNTTNFDFGVNSLNALISVLVNGRGNAFTPTVPTFFTNAVGLRTGGFAITQVIEGRNGDTTITSSLGTLNLTITSFSGGASSVSVDTTITVIDILGATETFFGKDTVVDPTTQFLVGADQTEVFLSFATAITSNPVVNMGAIGSTIKQVIPGTLGNTPITSGGTDPTEFAFTSGGVPTATLVNGTDAGTVGDTLELIDTDGTTALFTIVAAGVSPAFNEIENTGLASELASNTATQITDYPGLDINIVSVVGNIVSLEQGTPGTDGDTTITEVGTSFNKVNFSGGADVYTRGQFIDIEDGDTPSNIINFEATASTLSATQFISNGDKAATASSLQQAIALAKAAATLRTTAVLVGERVDLTQDDLGAQGNNLTPAPTAPGHGLTVVQFNGGTNTVGVGSITVDDTLGLSVPFVAGTDFTNTGTTDAVATDFALAVNASALAVSALAVGSTVTITQNEVGTIGNIEPITTTIGNVTVPAVNRFTGGVDNISVAGGLDALGNPTVAATIGFEDALGVSQVFTAVRAGAGATDFQVDQLNTANSMANLSATVNAFAIDITGAPVGLTRVDFTQGTIGPNGNNLITTNKPLEFSLSGFSGGTYSVELGSRITLTATDGTTEIFEAIDIPAPAPVGAVGYDVEPTTLDTLNNLKTAIDASVLGGKITAVVADPFINFTQVTAGSGGNTPITVAFDALPITLSPTGFAGGTNSGLNLTNPLSPIAISVKELTVYNGNNILIVEDSESVSASEFNILNRSQQIEFSEYVFNGTGVDVEGQTSQPLSDENVDDGYKFIGFRDQPIVDPNSQVFVKVDAFITNLPTWDPGLGYPANTPRPKIPPVSFSINLVVDLLEDKVFGDSFAPSPASRAAANVKLSGREIDGNRIVLSNSVVKKPEI